MEPWNDATVKISIGARRALFALPIRPACSLLDEVKVATQLMRTRSVELKSGHIYYTYQGFTVKERCLTSLISCSGFVTESCILF